MRYPYSKAGRNKDYFGADGHRCEVHQSLGQNVANSKTKILLVDDQPSNRTVLKAILERLDLTLVEASSGHEALQRMLEDEFAVVLLDVQMVDVDGFVTAKQITSREETRYTPIIFQTAYDADRETIEKAYEMGAVDFLVKPLMSIMLQAKVMGFVELFQHKEENKRQAELLRQAERRDLQQQLAEENARLRESEQRFRLMADAAPVLIWLSDTNAQCTWFNKPWLDFVGRRMDQEIGNGWTENVHPDDCDLSLQTFKTSFDGRQPFSMEYRLRRYDGEYRWTLNQGIPLYGADGDFTGYIGSCVDIDERKRMEEALKDADRRKDDFLATLAHELRNPLAPIRNALELMKLTEKTEPLIEQAREVMQRQVTQMVRLVDDLLDLSRITRGKVQLRKERIPLTPIIHNAIESTQPLIEAQAHELTVTFPPQPIHMDADPIRLSQVISNLLNNAAKYTDKGGKIWLNAERQDGEVVLSVRDNGIGIDPKQLPHVFEMFSQSVPALERCQGGLGIGLSLVRGLVELHGGSVEASSGGVGQGTEMVVRLPVADEREVSEKPVRNDKVMSNRPCRILVVDDNRDAADTLAMMLSLKGHVVQAVYDGPAAIHPHPCRIRWTNRRGCRSPEHQHGRKNHRSLLGCSPWCWDQCRGLQSG